MIRVLIVDDHTVVREGLAGLLANKDGIEVVGSAGDGDEAMTAVEALVPDVVLMDLSMPGTDGVAATRWVAQNAPSVKVVILTSFSQKERILEAIEAGAVGYLLKDADPDELIRGIRAAAGGDAPFSPKAARAFLPSPADRSSVREPDLTSRERQILALVAEGLNNKTIASRLGIAEKTVKSHLTNAFAAIGVSDRTQAALWVMRHWS